jgi:Domain of unknown function (DUF4360)
MLSVMAIGSMALSLFASWAAAPAAAVAPAAPPPPSGQVTVQKVMVNGSGCRPHTALVGMSADNTAFTVTYSEYLAQVGPGSKPKDATKDCKIRLKFDIPKNYTYAIPEVDYRGYALLEGGASALESATYYFHGNTPIAARKHPFRGPVDDDWQATDTTAEGNLIWAPCGKAHKLNIETELSLNAGTSDPSATSLMSMDSTDSTVSTIYRLTWKRCN